ncbi:MAG TPA: hypothetical protein VLB44_15315 [Kofleriaceae bacterium]|nr:hypothetical protein [Kofleriaceae bacterium]
MRRVLPLFILLACATAHAGPKDRQSARILSGTAAAVAGGVTLAGFVTAKEGEPFNQPVLYTGVGLLMVTPSLGEFYAGQYLTYGMGVRAAATALAIYALRTQVKAVRCDTVGASYDLACKSFTENAYPLLGVSAIAFVGGVWYDVLDAPDAADRYNRSHGYVVTPTALPGPQGMAPGLVVSGSF